MNDKLPTIANYSRYLNIASMRFNKTLEQCRRDYGLFTVAQWEDLLSSEPLFTHKLPVFEWLEHTGNIHYINKDAVLERISNFNK